MQSPTPHNDRPSAPPGVPGIRFLVRIARFAIALAAIAFLAAAGWDAGRQGLEDWRVTRSYHEARAWIEGRAVPTEPQWQRAVDTLRGALRLTPRDPEIWEYLGLLYDFGARKFVPNGSWNVYTEFALVHYRKAASLRPTSPYAWAGVAVMKSRLGQVDAELGRALAAAMRLGPWEPGVQLIASELGLRLWDRLDSALKDSIRANWRRTAARQADALARLASAYGRMGVLCEEVLDPIKTKLKCPA